MRSPHLHDGVRPGRPHPLRPPPPPKRPQHQPYPHVKPAYGQKVQYAKDNDDSPLLSRADKKFVQEVIGVFLYYARAVDLTMLPALGTLSTQQASSLKTQ